MMPYHQNPIFHQITEQEYEEMVSTGGIRLATFQKDAALFRIGDVTRELGILLSGSIHIEIMDLWGNRMILHNISPGQAFAESYAFCGAPMTVDVTAVEASQVLFLHVEHLLSHAQQHSSWYHKLLYNLLTLSTQKNLIWSNRMFCISSKHIRTRVMTYLSSEAVRHNSMEVTIPFDRQQMADYLNVERSALSKELSRMRREGILTFHKNQFRLLRPVPNRIP